MNNRTLLHVLLIASLCFSQLAANVHMVGHFHESHNQHLHASHAIKTSHIFKNSGKTSAGSSSSILAQSFVESYARAHQHSGTPLSTELSSTYRTEHHSNEHSSREHRTVGDHELQHHTTNHQKSVDQQSDKVNKSDSHNNLDCAIYHAYLGQSGCLAAFTAGLAIDSVSITNTPVTSAHVATTAVFNRPIRAPPSPS